MLRQKERISYIRLKKEQINAIHLQRDDGKFMVSPDPVCKSQYPFVMTLKNLQIKLKLTLFILSNFFIIWLLLVAFVLF